MYVVTSFRCWQPGLTHRGNYSNTWTFVQWSKPRSNQMWGGMIPQPPRALSGKVHDGYDHGLGDFRVFPDPCMSYCLQLEMNYFSVHCMINERKMTKMCGLFFFLQTLSSVLMLRYNLETAFTLHQNYYTEYPNHIMNIFSWHYLICMSIIP